MTFTENSLGVLIIALREKIPFYYSDGWHASHLPMSLIITRPVFRNRIKRLANHPNRNSVTKNRMKEAQVSFIDIASSPKFLSQTPYMRWIHGRVNSSCAVTPPFMRCPVSRPYLYAKPHSSADQPLHTPLFSPSWRILLSLLGSRMRNKGSWFLPFH